MLVQILELRKAGSGIERCADKHRKRREAAFCKLLDHLLDTNTHDAHAVQQLLDVALVQM